MSSSAAPTFADKFKKGAQRRSYVSSDAGAIANAGPDDQFVVPQPDAPALRIPGQNFFVLSYAAPEGARVKAKKVAIKVSGCFPDEASAEIQAANIRNADPRLEVHVCEMYNWGTIPMPTDVKQFTKKEYTDKFLHGIMQAQQKAFTQSRKEIDSRMKRDRENAERELKKKYGEDYVMSSKPEAVKEYETEKAERQAQTASMNFSQSELVDSFATYIQKCGNIDPAAAGDFMRFLEAKKLAQDEASSSGSSAPEAPTKLGSASTSSSSSSDKQ